MRGVQIFQYNLFYVMTIEDSGNTVNAIVFRIATACGCYRRFSNLNVVFKTFELDIGRFAVKEETDLNTDIKLSRPLFPEGNAFMVATFISS